MFEDYKDQNQYGNSRTTGSYDSYGSYRYSGYSGDGDNKKGKKDKKKGGFARSMAVCICLALVFGVVAGAAFQVTDYLGEQVTSASAEEAAVSGGEDEGDSDVASVLEKNAQSETGDSSGSAVTTVYDVSQVVEKMMPSMVAITSSGVTEIQSLFGTFQQPSQSSGSGIIIGQNDSELLIATNNHVVENAQELNVCFVDNEIVSAQVRGTDPVNDLAVVSVQIADIKDSTMSQIAIAEIGDSDSLQIGEPVIAIGNALGYGQSVTVGVVSALNRSLEVSSTSTSTGGVATNLIQTDAAINPGNSGGALVNINGQVIGINSAKLASNEVEGMGYAIPMSTAEPILSDLMNRTPREKVAEEERGYLGISGADVTEDVTSIYNIPTGAYVVTVNEGSAADKAGIRQGDVITEFDGLTVSSMTGLKDTMSYYRAGETVEVGLLTSRDGEWVEETVTVTLDDALSQ